MKKGITRAVFAIVAVAGSVFGQPSQFTPGDHLFPSKGSSMVTITTGIPYLGIAEYAFGFSDRFSIGVIAGVTPNVEGYGVRIRGILYRPTENFRLYVRAPIFYYPHTKDLGGDPWVLAWPVIAAEWKLHSGTRLSLGGGVVVASCYHSLLRHLGLRSAAPGGNHQEEKGLMGGIWNTIHAGVALPISQRIMFQAEASLVMKGIRPAGGDWVGGPPVIVVTGLSFAL